MDIVTADTIMKRYLWTVLEKRSSLLSYGVGLPVHFLGRLAVFLFFGLGLVVLHRSELKATDTSATQAPFQVINPGRYRGWYVPPAGPVEQPDPFAPGPDSPYWVPLEMTDPGGHKTFAPHTVEMASRLRYEQHDPERGLDLRIYLDMHPQPFMTVNEKIYPVQVDLRGWMLVAHVTADVDTRQFEKAWFDAFVGQSATISALPSTAAVPGSFSDFYVEATSFIPIQKTVVHDGRQIVSRAVYVASLTLRETLTAFLSRQWQLALHQSIILAYGAFIGVFSSLLVGGLVAVGRRSWHSSRSRKGPKLRSTSKTTPRTRVRRNKKRSKKRR